MRRQGLRILAIAYAQTGFQRQEEAERAISRCSGPVFDEVYPRIASY